MFKKRLIPGIFGFLSLVSSLPAVIPVPVWQLETIKAELSDIDGDWRVGVNTVSHK